MFCLDLTVLYFCTLTSTWAIRNHATTTNLLLSSCWWRACIGFWLNLSECVVRCGGGGVCCVAGGAGGVAACRGVGVGVADLGIASGVTGDGAGLLDVKTPFCKF